MVKAEFLNKLGVALDRHLSSEEITRAILYYDELIIEAVEEGKKEEDIINELGSVEDIAAKIKAETFFQRAEKKGKMSGYLKAIIAVLGIFALPMVIAVIAVIFALLIALFSIVISIFAVAVSIGIAGVVLLGLGFITLVSGSITFGGCLIGTGMILAGITIFAVMLSIKLTLWCRILFNKIFKNIYKMLNKKGGMKYE